MKWPLPSLSQLARKTRRKVPRQQLTGKRMTSIWNKPLLLSYCLFTFITAFIKKMNYREHKKMNTGNIKSEIRKEENTNSQPV